MTHEQTSRLVGLVSKQFIDLKWLRLHLNCPPWLEKILNFIDLKWVKLHLNCPPWLEKIIQGNKNAQGVVRTGLRRVLWEKEKREKEEKFIKIEEYRIFAPIRPKYRAETRKQGRSPKTGHNGH